MSTAATDPAGNSPDASTTPPCSTPSPPCWMRPRNPPAATKPENQHNAAPKPWPTCADTPSTTHPPPWSRTPAGDDHTSTSSSDSKTWKRGPEQRCSTSAANSHQNPYACSRATAQSSPSSSTAPANPSRSDAPPRTIPDGLRRAVTVRDRGCAFPGRDRPPSWCEIHHLTAWEDHGHTKIDNLAMLCRTHHRLIHHSGWTARLRDGHPEFTPPAWIDPAQRPRRKPGPTITIPDPRRAGPAPTTTATGTGTRIRVADLSNLFGAPTPDRMRS